MYNSRHDDAMRRVPVFKAITGSHGSFLKIAGIGRGGLMKDFITVSKITPAAALHLSDEDLQAEGL